MSRTTHLSKVQCEAWLANPTVNPKTNRSIDVNGPTYNMIKEHCSKYGDLNVPGISNPVPKTETETEKMPKKVNGINLPQTKTEWVKNDWTNTFFKNIIYMYEILHFVTESDYKMFPTYEKICNLGLQYDIVPDDLIVSVREMATKFNNYYERPDPETFMVTEKYENEYARDTRTHKGAYSYYLQQKLVLQISKVVENGITQSQLDNEVFRDLQIEFKSKVCIQDYNLLIESNDVTNKLARIRETHKYNKLYDLFIKVVNEYTEILKNRKKVNNALDKTSHSAPVPESLSKRKYKMKVPKPLKMTTRLIDGVERQVPDRSVPQEFTEKSFTSEPATDRSSFRPHDALSAMSPFSLGSLEPLTPKKRVELLKELKSACMDMRDHISSDRFDRMKKKNLQLIVKIGTSVHGKQNCYYVKNIYKLWNELAKDNKTLTDPLTRQTVTDIEKEDIMNKVKYLNKKAPNPDNIGLNKDPHLNLIVSANQYNHGSYYGLVAQRDIAHLGDNKIMYSRILGYIPADIEDVNGDTNISSAALIGKYIELFDKGKIMSSNFAPFKCCRINNKSLSYWDVPREEKLRKFAHMANELFHH